MRVTFSLRLLPTLFVLGAWGCGGGDGGTHPVPAADRAVFVGGILQNGAALAVDTNDHATDWAAVTDGSLVMQYPAGKTWGSVGIVATAPQNFAGLASLEFEARTDQGVASVDVGIKADTDPAGHLEPTARASGITTEWKAFKLSAKNFAGSRFPANRMARLQVLSEFIFNGPAARRIEVRNVRFTSAKASLLPYVVFDGALGNGLRSELYTSGNLGGWYSQNDDAITLAFPAGQVWSVSVLAVNPTLPSGSEGSLNLTNFRALKVEMKGAVGGEVVSVNSSTLSDHDGIEPDTYFSLTNEWKTYTVFASDLQRDGVDRLTDTQAPMTIISGLPIAQTVFVRNARYVP